MKQIIGTMLLLALFSEGFEANAAARVKELVSIEGVRDNQLIGYGLVVGLAGTGDRGRPCFPRRA